VTELNGAGRGVSIGQQAIALPPAVGRFLQAIADRDIDAVADCFTVDAVYAFAVPRPPVRGRDAIRNLLAQLLESCERVEWEVLAAAVDGERVWLERIDRFWFSGREAAIECAGIFELEGEQIRELRDYVDVQTWRSRREAS
jgi:limonene-1,2-epoxide hydrolase